MLGIGRTDRRAEAVFSVRGSFRMHYDHWAAEFGHCYVGESVSTPCSSFDIAFACVGRTVTYLWRLGPRFDGWLDDRPGLDGEKIGSGGEEVH